MMRRGAATLWVSRTGRLFPPALTAFGICPEQVLFLDPKNDKQALWAVEEALKCTALVAVVGELPELSFTESRRFQLAIERSGAACFLLRLHPKNMTTAAVTRWKIRSLPSEPEAGLPGIGHPRWQVELLKVRNGRPGSWELEWANGHFEAVDRVAVLPLSRQTKSA